MAVQRSRKIILLKACSGNAEKQVSSFVETFKNTQAIAIKNKAIVGEL